MIIQEIKAKTINSTIIKPARIYIKTSKKI